MSVITAVSSYRVIRLHTEVTSLRERIDEAMVLRSDPKYIIGEPRIECTFRPTHYRYPDFVYHDWNLQDRVIVVLINKAEAAEFDQRLWYIRTTTSGAVTMIAIAAFALHRDSKIRASAGIRTQLTKTRRTTD